MSDDNNGDLVPEGDQTIDLKALIPLGAQLIENSNNNAQAQIQFQQDNLEFSKEKLKIQKSAFNHKFWLLTFITTAIIGISVGLIFISKDISSGISILSHVGAVVVGIIAGSGWERIRAN